MQPEQKQNMHIMMWKFGQVQEMIRMMIIKTITEIRETATAQMVETRATTGTRIQTMETRTRTELLQSVR